MDWFILILNLVVTLYCFHEWKKHKDKEFAWLAIAGLIATLLVIVSYFDNYIFNFSQEFTITIDTFIHYSWLLIFLVMFVSVVKNLKKIARNK